MRTEVVKVVVQSADPVLHETASNQARRENALTALNNACSTEELESLASIASFADIGTVVHDARHRWGNS